MIDGVRLRSSLAVATTVLICAGAAMGASQPRGVFSSVEIFGQPDSSQELTDRPIGKTVTLFTGGVAARLPVPDGVMASLSSVAAHFHGNPGPLLLAKARKIATPAGDVYFVPTTHGWVCVQGPKFETCHRGLLRQGLTWNFYSHSTHLDVFGIAANNVRAIRLTWGGKDRWTHLTHNAFFVRRPFSFTSLMHLPAFGRLLIYYRGQKTPASVSLQVNVVVHRSRRP